MSNEFFFVLLRDATIVLATFMLVRYFIFLLLAAIFSVAEPLRKLKVLKQEIKQRGHIKKFNPRISVIIPARDEEVGIIHTLKSILASPFQNLEVIVVNDGSTDNSRDLVNAYFASLRQTGETRAMRQIYIKNSGKGRALNTGIKNSSGAIILTIDADTIIMPNAFYNLAQHFRDPRVAAVVGQVRIGNVRGRAIGYMQFLEYLFGFYFKRAHCVLGAEYIYGGACAAFRRSATFDFFGHFDEASKTEDIEMSMRTKFFGMRSVYAEDVVCYTEGAATFMGLIQQRLRWKKGRFDAFIRYRRMFFSLKRCHNKPLGWFILPYALFSELQLFLEPIGATFLIAYSILSGEFTPLALSMLFIGITYFVVAIFGRELKLKQRINLILLWPLTWALFYILMWIEFMALVRGWHMVLRGDSLSWQHWRREGIDE